jgi:hypothetical protein
VVGGVLLGALIAVGTAALFDIAAPGAFERRH